MPDSRRGGRSFAPLPPGVVKVRLSGSSAPRLAAIITRTPGVTVLTGPDEYPGERLYLLVSVADAEQVNPVAGTQED